MSSAISSDNDIIHTINNIQSNNNYNNTQYIPLFTFVALLITTLPTYLYSIVLNYLIKDNVIVYTTVYTTSILILIYTYNITYNNLYNKQITSNKSINTRRNAATSTLTTTNYDNITLLSYTILLTNAVYIITVNTITFYILSTLVSTQINYIVSVLVSSGLSYLISYNISKL